MGKKKQQDAVVVGGEKELESLQEEQVEEVQEQELPSEPVVKKSANPNKSKNIKVFFPIATTFGKRYERGVYEFTESELKALQQQDLTFKLV